MGRGETVVSREGLVTFVSSLDCSSNAGELLPDFNSAFGLGGITTGCTNGGGVGEEEGEWPGMYASCLLRLRGGLAGTFCLGAGEGGRGIELVFFTTGRLRDIMGEVLGSSVTPSSPPVPLVPPIRVLSTGGSFLYPGGGLAGALCLGLNRYVLGLPSSVSSLVLLLGVGSPEVLVVGVSLCATPGSGKGATL